MGVYLGIDTSNYTTSLALYNSETNEVVQQKRLLPVKEGAIGLRQSNALFHHVKQLPELIEALCQNSPLRVDGIGVSQKPMERDGSYMPCFLAGEGLARELASVWHIPMVGLTHQQGHVAAACLGADCTNLLDTPFVAFHVSGGTTDALHIMPREDGGISCEWIGGSLDLKAGQLIDRVGARLGLPFPAGPALDALSLQSSAVFSCRASMDGSGCHLSGVENQCVAKIEAGMPFADVARFCLQSIAAALCGIADNLPARCHSLPFVFAGGVMSNTMLHDILTARYNGYFAPPLFSADNAAGVALLAARILEKRV